MAIRIQDAKLALRQQVSAKLATMAEVDRATASAKAYSLLRRQKLWEQARSVLFYAPLPQELDVWPLVANALSDNKIVALPRFVAERNLYVACEVRDPGRDLTLGQFGIREPAEHCASRAIYGLDFILVPGVAFDLQGRRLGRGKGFYDQLLAVVRGKSCGVAFDEQIVREVPVEAHDVPVNCILTPTRWIEL